MLKPAVLLNVLLWPGDRKCPRCLQTNFLTTLQQKPFSTGCLVFYGGHSKVNLIVIGPVRKI